MEKRIKRGRKKMRKVTVSYVALKYQIHLFQVVVNINEFSRRFGGGIMKYVLKYLTLFRSSQFNVSAARQLGYPAPLIVMYHSGMLTDSLYSWVGLNANATLNGTIEQLYDARLEKISFEGATPEQVSERFFLPYSYCKVLKARPKSTVRIIIENVIDDYYFIFVSDVAALTNFQLPVYLLTGQKLYLHMKSKPEIKHYNIKLKEISDQTGKEDACTWYPNDAFDNYADCIDVDFLCTSLGLLVMPIIYFFCFGSSGCGMYRLFRFP